MQISLVMQVTKCEIQKIPEVILCESTVETLNDEHLSQEMEFELGKPVSFTLYYAELQVYLFSSISLFCWQI